MSYDRHARLVATTLFLLVGTLISIDIVSDHREGSSRLHLALEGSVLLLCALGIFALWTSLQRTRSNLQQARSDAIAWRREHDTLLRGLGDAVAQQFARWHLTAAESEVALLLLKGLSHKDIAGLRNTSERTIREQARAVYRKAELTGRAELAAFFLEDLLITGSAQPELRPEQSSGEGGSGNRSNYMGSE